MGEGMERLYRSVLLSLFASSLALAYQPRQNANRFDALALQPPNAVIEVRPLGLNELPQGDPLRSGWQAFGARHGGWTIHIDQRSGLPTLATGAGIPWIAGLGNSLAPMAGADTLTQLEARARAFLAENRVLLGDLSEQMQLDSAASGKASDSLWLVTYRQVIDGVPVEGARFDFQIVHGNLVAFGANDWVRVTNPTKPRFSSEQARAALLDYLQIAASDSVTEDGEPSLQLLPVDPRRARAGEWIGQRGAGLTHLLVWRFHLHLPGEESSWQAEVDAGSGRVIGLTDMTKYDRVKGGIFPLSSDGIGPEGSEQLDYPMPYADLAQDGSAQPATSPTGVYSCAAGSSVSTTLKGTYVRITDACGAINEATVCGEPLDIGSGSATNCVVPPGHSPGATRAARNCYFHVNRLKQVARFWLPDNTFLAGQLNVNSNVNATCNATWGGSLNMYRAGGGCRNTCELRGVFSHELGHGIDENDGGGYDDPTEAYADIISMFDVRESCNGRGFQDTNCSGYGDACLNCTGIRDLDWDKHAAHTPATPSNYGPSRCGNGDGPCGGEQHCEGYISGEALYDLAARDLVASGLDAATAWQVAERIWYQSRKGSGGNAYNCSLPSSDGCGTNSWFHKLRLADDDNGNLNDGTPHAAAIFAAFARHAIACGTAADNSNKNSSGCPALATPALTVTQESTGLRLSWPAVPNATSYRVYRTEIGCDRSTPVIATVTAPTTTFLDTDTPDNLSMSYRVQAVGSNPVCESAVSNCQSKAQVPYTGYVQFSNAAYACGATATLTVVDGNGGNGPLKIRVWSDSEQTPERITLNKISDGNFQGTIVLTTSAPLSNDGKISVAAGAQLTAQYDDANDAGGLPHVSIAKSIADCGASSPGSVRVTDLTDASATVRWSTPELSTGRVEWGPTTALGNVVQDAALGTEHAATLQGLNECGRYFFRVVARDRVGNETTLDAGGTPFALNVGLLPGFFRDDYEGTPSWTLEGEWQIAAPQGRGTNNPDPTAAFSGTKVLGHDLTGLGTRPGDYERSSNQRANSPVLNATGKTGVEIRFRRWLNANFQAAGYVEVRTNGGAWQQLWNSGINFGFHDSGWVTQTLSVPQADNQSNFQISFRMNGGSGSSGASSWNVDRFVVRQASDPQGAACGGCGGTPSFAGASAATDADLCSASGGVTVSWSAAASWGTGSSGSYSVYRDVTPNFTPTAANRIATGLAGLSYTDTTAANGTTYYYLVRAENDETCSTGPKNGGAVDANTSYRSVTTVSSQSTPVAVTGLKLQHPVGADLRLTWNALAAGNNSYRVYRSASPQAAGFALRTTTSALVVDELGAASDGANWFYLVKGLNACGAEGP